jgi:hypothetical protein
VFIAAVVVGFCRQTAAATALKSGYNSTSGYYGLPQEAVDRELL